MNVRTQKNGPRAFTLIETLVYIAVAVVVVGFAFGTFYDCWGSAKSLRRNADDIVRALAVGDRWRADIRAATGAIQLTGGGDTQQCLIPTSAGEIAYTLSDGQLRRQPGSGLPPTTWLANVKSSHMQLEPRGGVQAWRWELELKTVRRETLMRPLFTFECAAPTP